MRNIQICHVISSIDKNYGGSAAFVQLISNELVKYKKVSIVTNKSNCPLDINNSVQIFTASTSFRILQGYSDELKSILNCIETDLFHGNGLWQFPVHFMAQVARKKNVSYIISPHGMLEPWALNAGKWKKKMALWFYQNKDLAFATCIHATAPKEADNIRSLGFKNPIAVIPNGIDLSEFPFPEKKQEKAKSTVLFLSRIHPSKGIELLIKAWEFLPVSLRNDWQIKIAGNGETEYIASLQQIINSKRLENEIYIVGPQFNMDKLKLYHEADLFVLPSYSENFGIVVAEALACCIPVITTKATPWEELNTYNAGWWIEIGADSLASTMLQAIQMDNAKRKQMGQNGRQLIAENYSIELVTLKMVELYDWSLGKAKKPSFVRLD
jgi:glycosyltransferase involved in cell wall biosynthesis